MGHGVHGHTTPPIIDATLARTVAERMQMLATPSRVQILGRLKHGSCSVGALAEAVGMESSAVSHQLRSLRQLGLVVGERRGNRSSTDYTTPTSPSCSTRRCSTFGT